MPPAVRKFSVVISGLPGIGKSALAHRHPGSSRGDNGVSGSVQIQQTLEDFSVGHRKIQPGPMSIARARGKLPHSVSSGESAIQDTVAA